MRSLACPLSLSFSFLFIRHPQSAFFPVYPPPRCCSPLFDSSSRHFQPPKTLVCRERKKRGRSAGKMEEERKIGGGAGRRREERGQSRGWKSIPLGGVTSRAQLARARVSFRRGFRILAAVDWRFLRFRFSHVETAMHTVREPDLYSPQSSVHHAPSYG